jgi:hypothetical protein
MEKGKELTEKKRRSNRPSNHLNIQNDFRNTQESSGLIIVNA